MRTFSLWSINNANEKREHLAFEAFINNNYYRSAAVRVGVARIQAFWVREWYMKHKFMGSYNYTFILQYCNKVFGFDQKFENKNDLFAVGLVRIASSTMMAKKPLSLKQNVEYVS